MERGRAQFHIRFVQFTPLVRLRERKREMKLNRGSQSALSCSVYRALERKEGRKRIYPGIIADQINRNFQRKWTKIKFAGCLFNIQLKLRRKRRMFECRGFNRVILQRTPCRTSGNVNVSKRGARDQEESSIVRD